MLCSAASTSSPAARCSSTRASTCAANRSCARRGTPTAASCGRSWSTSSSGPTSWTRRSSRRSATTWTGGASTSWTRRVTRDCRARKRRRRPRLPAPPSRVTPLTDRAAAGGYLLVVGGKHRLQIRRALERLIRILRPPGVRIVEHRRGDECCPGGENLLLLARGREKVVATAIVGPVATAKGLIHGHDAPDWNACRLCGGHGDRDPAVVAAAELAPAGIGIESVQVDMRITGVVRVGVGWRFGRAEVHQGDECLGAGDVGVDPIRLGPQVVGWTERIPLPRGVRFIHEVETEQLGIADEGLDGIDEGRVGAIAETQPDQSLGPARERTERADTT